MKKTPGPINPYQKSSIETASPGRIVLMLFDGALKFLDLAKAGFEESNVVKRNEIINNNLVRVLNIIAELQGSLDHSAGQVSTHLDNCYTFVYQRLTAANIKKDISQIPDAEKVLKDLRDSWAEMLLKADDKPANTSKKLPSDKPSPNISSFSQSA